LNIRSETNRAGSTHSSPAFELTLAYATLNLRFNPFGRLTPEEEGKLTRPLVDVDALAGRLWQPGFAVLFLGESGRGKSTHLFALHTCFPDAPYVYIPAGKPVPEIPIAPVLFLDEMQRITRRQRWAILARPASFVIGSHKNHEREFRQAGLSYEVYRLAEVTVVRLGAILNGRLEHARRDPARPIPVIDAGAAEVLIGRFGGDQWAMIDFLYDRIEEMQATAQLSFNLGK
jgi:hypothetical protein